MADGNALRKDFGGKFSSSQGCGVDQCGALREARSPAQAKADAVNAFLAATGPEREAARQAMVRAIDLCRAPRGTFHTVTKAFHDGEMP